MLDEKPSSKRPIGIQSNGVSYRVVVVDDEFSHRRIMVQLLKSAGFDIVGEGVNGEDALRLVAELDPKYLFLDYHMPRLDGLEALKQLHQNHPGTKVVVCTTDHDKDKVLSFLKAGAVEYIVKPIDRKLVMSKLETLIGAI